MFNQKDCPFCGSEFVRCEYNPDLGLKYISCMRCGASGPCISFEGSNDLNQNEAWELWNNRV